MHLLINIDFARGRIMQRGMIHVRIVGMSNVEYKELAWVEKSIAQICNKCREDINHVLRILRGS